MTKQELLTKWRKEKEKLEMQIASAREKHHQYPQVRLRRTKLLSEFIEDLESLPDLSPINRKIDVWELE